VTAAATRIAASLVLLAPAPMSGCSFIFVSRARRDSPGHLEPAGCTTSRAMPIVDSIVLGAAATATVAVLEQPVPTGYGDTKLSGGADVAVVVATALLFAASAFYGFSTVGTCREVSALARNPYDRAPAKQTRVERQSDEAAEEAAVQARLKEREAKEAEEAKAAGEAASRTSGDQKKAPPAH